MGRIAFGIRHRSAALASRRVDPRRRARSACFRPHASRRRPAGGIGSGTSARSAFRTRTVSPGASAVIFAASPATPLNRLQLAWLATLVVLAQVPLWAHLRLWTIVVGSGLVAARIALPADRPLPTRLRRWLLPLLALAVGLAIRWDFGYLLARDPCVAFLFVLVGIKFVEAKSARDGGLLICLALFLALTQFFYGQSIWAATIALPAVLVLGGALAALRDSPATTSEWKAPLAATARMLVQGIPLAALLFIIFPRLAGPLWGAPADAGARSGLSDRMAPGAISELSLSDTVAFRVDFNAPPPPPAQRYWRGPVLSRFDGFEWSMLPWVRRGTLAPPSTRAIVEHPRSLPQPAADDPFANPGPARELAVLGYDHQLLATAPVTQAIRYTLRSTLADSFAARGDTDRRDNLQLPRRNPRTIEFARELKNHAVSDRAYIAAVLDWFRKESFIYTLAPPLLAGDTVDAFLFDTRRGFCEHYA
ncbi:MAG: DUF3488 domain-containing protein, partial [Betaproteobacteria bacterium]